MGRILSKHNLNKAYLQVIRNKGVEGVKYMELKKRLEKNGEIIGKQLG